MCVGQMRLLAFVTDGTQIGKIKNHIGANSKPVHIFAMRGLRFWQDCGDAQVIAAGKGEANWDQRVD